MENVKHRTWHSKSRSRLAQKGLKIGALVNPYLDVAQLKEYGICVSQSDLAESEHLPQYFRPASPETLASLEDRRQKLPRPPQPGDLDYYEDDHRLALANYWQARTNSHQLTVQWLNGPTYDQEGPNLLQTTTWGTKGIWNGTERHLHRNMRHSEEYPQEWSLCGIFETANPIQHPHEVCLLNQGFENVGPLLKSEVLSIIGILLERMGPEWSKAHLIFPLLMVSMIGPQGRILQAHWDGDKLYVQYSQLYELRDYNKDNMDLFLRWLMNKPIGDTAIIAPEVDNDLGSIHKSPSKKIGNSHRSQFGISLAA